MDRLGVRPAQESIPILVGGHGKRVVTIAAEQADIFQFTGLTHEPVTGIASPGGFSRARVAKHSAGLRRAAGERYNQLELSALVQRTYVGEGASQERQAAATRMGVEPSLIDETPFLLIGSKAQVAEKLLGLREEFGIHHIVSRDPEGFAPIVAALTGK